MLTGEKHTESPEQTERYECPECGNVERFIGYDDRGFPGDECECEAQDTDQECTCEVTLAQPFRVEWDNGRPDVVYEAFTGGGCDAMIGQYTRIECVECYSEIWTEED